MEILEIRNFGPIKDAKLLIKNITVFIGLTSSGKSTVAKLLAIFQGQMLKRDPEYGRFRLLLKEYNIAFDMLNETYIRYDNGPYFCQIGVGSFVQSNFGNDALSADRYNPIYIPAERIFFPTFSQSILSLLSNDIALPRWLVEFGAKFEVARTNLTTHPIDFLGVDYEYEGQNDYVRLSDGVVIKLSQASSGLQSVIPLVLVVHYYTLIRNDFDNLFVIEEPELNLYPTAQKDLMNYLITRVNGARDKLIITTHSPYLITALDNLIQAGNVVRENSSLQAEVASVIPAVRWVSYEDVSCYFFDKGTCYSTLDPEMRSIGPSNIDDVSTTLSETYEKLLALKYSS